MLIFHASVTGKLGHYQEAESGSNELKKTKKTKRKDGNFQKYLLGKFLGLKSYTCNLCKVALMQYYTLAF